MDTAFLLISVLFVAVIAYAFYRQGVSNRLATEALVNMGKVVGDALSKSVSDLAMLKGIHPHQADPAEFGPTGVSWRTLEKAQKAISMDEAAALQTRLYKVEQARDLWMLKGQVEKAESYSREIDALKQRLNGDENAV